MPLCVTDARGVDVTDRFLDVTPDGVLVLRPDVTPVMMVTNARQARKDCLFYIARRRT
ncbi:MAG: hypothetical protein M3N17_02050 [Actinomycetota bacterium]|nr:hypothetical protein [Actinomycetota bacterium]